MRLGAETAPLAVAFNCVNIITGDFFFDTGVMLDAPCPTRCSRIYDSGLNYLGNYGYSFSTDLPLRVSQISVDSNFKSAWRA